MPAHEMIDAEVRRNNVRVRNLLFELPIQKPVAQAILPCKGFLRDGPQAPEELLQRIAVLLLVLWRRIVPPVVVLAAAKERGLSGIFSKLEFVVVRKQFLQAITLRPLNLGKCKKQ